jgi:hypothetical protein
MAETCWVSFAAADRQLGAGMLGRTAVDITRPDPRMRAMPGLDEDAVHNPARFGVCFPTSLAGQYLIMWRPDLLEPYALNRRAFDSWLPRHCYPSTADLRQVATFVAATAAPALRAVKEAAAALVFRAVDNGQASQWAPKSSAVHSNVQCTRCAHTADVFPKPAAGARQAAMPGLNPARRGVAACFSVNHMSSHVFVVVLLRAKARCCVRICLRCLSAASHRCCGRFGPVVDKL